MALTTTATSTHTLLKYSRSYPTTNTNSRVSESESTACWQHFTNPVIHLVLDLRKSSSGDLDSVRLRILWLMDTGDTSGDASSTEVILENIDLLSFSTIPLRKGQKFASQGLPLKAVYRDSIVGIRYLHPLESAITAPSYRRFQMTFQSPTAASQFIESIQSVCPCKENTTPAQQPTLGIGSIARPSFLPPATMSASQPTPFPQRESVAANATSFAAPNWPIPHQLTVPVTPTRPSLPASSPAGYDYRSLIQMYSGNSPHQFSQDRPLPSLQDGYSLSRTPMPLDHPAPPPPTINTSVNLMNPSQPQFLGNWQESLLFGAQGPTPSGVPLYSQSRDTLARLVGEIIQEDSFQRLLADLSCVWRQT